MIKALFKIVLFIVTSMLLVVIIGNYGTQPDIIKDAINWQFDPNEKIELLGFVYSNINDSLFYVSVFGFDRPVLVVHNFKREFPLSKAHTITLWGTFDADGTFHALDYRMSYWQIAKYVLSLVGLFWFLLIFFKEWKITWKGFAERKKNA